MGRKVTVALLGRTHRRAIPLTTLLICLVLCCEPSAFAEDGAAACQLARVVAIQGTVELQRTGSTNWIPVTQLDTPVCAGDRLRTAPLSRAGLFVEPETLVRVDQNTTITLSQTPTEVLVEFSQESVAPDVRNAKSCGAGYFITRFPRRFEVNTPHLNAAVEGTEFQVVLQCESTELTVLEGAVLSQTSATGEERTVTGGQVLVAGPATSAVFSTLIKPNDAVQWVLYYPSLSDAATGDLPTAEQCRGRPAPANQACLTQRAEMLLRLGQVDDALRNIDEMLLLNPSDGDANALKAVIQIAKNDKAAAMESANAAIASSPDDVRAWLAHSYAQQASFDLDQALDSAQKAQTLRPNSSLVNARVAELLLSLGRNGDAERSARAAVASNPDESRGHTMLGFVHLAQINTKAARADFEVAIDRDSFDPLPRLGLGLAMIRDGKLVNGREQIEIAVALDPNNSMLRSYVGKAYYEENTKARDELAATQFAVAETLDPKDPTPWFYDSILKDSQTRPALALTDLDKSEELNDDRAVYRSRLLLDQDLAARGASQASVYNELGFHQLGLEASSQSLAVDPGSSSAHRFLADIYATTPRYEIARSSELLQAQLRQPLGAPPLQAQLANDVLFKNTFFGPATVGLNEFNPLFLENGTDLQLFGLVGDNETYGDQVILNGLHGPVSFSLSQFAVETDGYRPNNDDSTRQYDGFVQTQIGADTSAQVEVTSSRQKSGDLQSAFDPTFFSEALDADDDVDTQRVGLRYVINSNSDVLLSAIRQNRNSSLSIDDPIFPVTINSDQESWKAESQYLTRGGGFDLILGASYFDGNSEVEFVTPFFTDDTKSAPTHTNAYGYAYLPTRAGLPLVQLGLSYDDLHSDDGDQSKVNPKIGLIWKPAEFITLRAAGFQVLKRRINSDQGLEPTQIAGFNQFFDDPNGSDSRVEGLAADFTLSRAAAAGAQFTRRSVKVPFVLNGEVFSDRRTEKAASAYVYWLPSNSVSFTLEPRYGDLNHGATFESMKLTEAPLAVRFFLSFGLWIGVSVTGVKQEGEFDGPGGVRADGSDTFGLVDAIVAYRLPRRIGTISLQVTNLLSENFRFQEIDPTLLPRYVPESRVFLRMSAAF